MPRKAQNIAPIASTAANIISQFCNQNIAPIASTAANIISQL